MCVIFQNPNDISSVFIMSIVILAQFTSSSIDIYLSYFRIPKIYHMYSMIMLLAQFLSAVIMCVIFQNPNDISCVFITSLVILAQFTSSSIDMYLSYFRIPMIYPLYLLRPL